MKRSRIFFGLPVVVALCSTTELMAQQRDTKKPSKPAPVKPAEPTKPAAATVPSAAVAPVTSQEAARPLLDKDKRPAPGNVQLKESPDDKKPAEPAARPLTDAKGRPAPGNMSKKCSKEEEQRAQPAQEARRAAP